MGPLLADLAQSQTTGQLFPFLGDGLDQVAVSSFSQHHVHVPRLVGGAIQAGAETAGPHLWAGQPDEGRLLPALGVVGVGRLVLQEQSIQHLQAPRIAGPYPKDDLFSLQRRLGQAHFTVPFGDGQDGLGVGKKVLLGRHVRPGEVKGDLVGRGHRLVKDVVLHHRGRDDGVLFHQLGQPGDQVLSGCSFHGPPYHSGRSSSRLKVASGGGVSGSPPDR